MNSAYDNYIICAIEQLPDSQPDFLMLKKKLSKQFRLPIPTNADLRDRYNQLVANKKIKKSLPFEKILLSRSIRTQSGVAVVAVLTKPYPCPGKCIYCPTEKDMPKSYLSNEPAVMRAIDSQFDPYRQVQNRLRSLELNGHSTDKIELIVMGGTFSYLPKAYQKKFIVECFRACNDYPGCHPEQSEGSKDSSATPQNDKLNKEQKKNENAKHRIVGLTLETRPDFIDEQEIKNFREFGCTRVELGVQSLFDDVLAYNQRGHLVNETIRATKLLKNAGFKINYHMMPGLPLSTPERDFEMFKILFSNADFQPDMLKIYPTVVLRDSALFNLWKKKQFVPLDDAQFEKLVLKVKNEIIPPYVRIARLVRDVPTTSIIAGPIVSNLRQIIAKKSHCQCIRCREVRTEYNIDEKIILDRIDYDASGGKEFFLQYVSKEPSASLPPLDKGRAGMRSNGQKLFALLRLRIPSTCHSRLDRGSRKKHSLDSRFRGNDKMYKHFPVLENAAIVREVHTYGKMTKIDTQDSNSPQHIGLGKKLLQEAERITKEEYGLKKIAVISGVGVRGYYRKNGYRLRDSYMVKNL